MARVIFATSLLLLLVDQADVVPEGVTDQSITVLLVNQQPELFPLTGVSLLASVRLPLAAVLRLTVHIHFTLLFVNIFLEFNA